MGMKQAFETFATSPPKRVSRKIGLLRLLPLHHLRVFSMFFHTSRENRISNTLSVQGFKSGKRFQFTSDDVKLD